MTVYYSSELASPLPFIQFDVTDHSLEPAQKFSARVWNGGVAVPLSNGDTVVYFSNQGGTTGATATPGLQIRGAALATGAYSLTLEVRSHWASGTQPAATTQAVRVLVVNRGGSRFGAGWGVYGLQRIHVQPDGLVMDEGDGSARFFAGAGPSYTTPEGDFSTRRHRSRIRGGPGPSPLTRTAPRRHRQCPG